MDNTYCRKDYSEGKATVVEITQIRPQKMKKNIAMASFYCVISQIWKKIVFYIVRRREKKRPGLYCFLKANITSTKN